MNSETGCSPKKGKNSARIESIPFSGIPGQSKLFIQYQTDPLSLKKFYPSTVEDLSKLALRIPDVLSAYPTDRKLLCDALADINTKYNAGEKTFENLELLRDSETVAIVTGQQAGLFTGPLYSIYKALSAVKMAESLREKGIKAVPVFWIASEDHDFEEVSEAYIVDKDQKIAGAKVTAVAGDEEKPVGMISVNHSAQDAVELFFEHLPQTEFSNEIKSVLLEEWSNGAGFGEAFGKTIAKILQAYGIIIIDPLDERLKQLSAQVYAQAILHSDEIVKALIARGKELEAAGYHAQVLVEEDYFPLFWHDDDGKRRSLKKVNDGVFRAKGLKAEFTTAELTEMALRSPERFSPGVMLRPVVQDHLLPTLCYFGGGAEIAYFAQNSEVYRILERPFTTILHRQSFTVVEARHGRIMEKYGIAFSDLFGGDETLTQRIVEQFVNPGASVMFAEVEEKINIELNRLDQELSQSDVTLAANLATRRRKMLYHIGALRKKFYFSQLNQNEILDRQMKSVFTNLLPHGHLQERTINAASFLDRYGFYFIDWIYDAIDLDDKDHRVIYL